MTSPYINSLCKTLLYKISLQVTSFYKMSLHMISVYMIPLYMTTWHHPILPHWSLDCFQKLHLIKLHSSTQLHICEVMHMTVLTVKTHHSTYSVLLFSYNLMRYEAIYKMKMKWNWNQELNVIFLIYFFQLIYSLCLLLLFVVVQRHAMNNVKLYTIGANL